jgi:ADP-ribosylglycohydrolase
LTRRAIVGSILGTAVGDAIGLPYEGMSKRRGVRLLGEPTRHRFFFGRGMVSDDTEHTCIVAQALIVSGGDPERFGRELARRLRWWLLGFPAGVGKATLQATLKLWLGFSHDHSGVFSAGNGPAMRSAILGAAVADRDALRTLVGVSTRITHTDPKAEYGAWAVALAARLARGGVVSPSAYLEELKLTSLPEAAEFRARMERCVQSAAAGQSTEGFAQAEGLGKGVSGYVYHTVPVALHAWLTHQHDFQAGVEAVVRCGGDTDTTAAIAGGIIGAGVGKEGIPAAWRDGLFEWPRTVAWMEALGERLAEGKPGPAPRLSVGVVGRNGLFFLIVLGHIVRRFLPPY